MAGASSATSPQIHAASTPEYVMVASDVTDWAHCTAALTATDPQGHVTAVWSGRCGQGPVGAAVIRFSVVPLAVAVATHQDYEPASAGAVGQWRLSAAILAAHRRSAASIIPNGACLGTYYHATADVYSQAPGAPHTQMHLDQKYNFDPVCNVHAYDYTYSKDSGSTVYRVSQSLLFDQGGAPIGQGGETGCAGPLGSSGGNFGGASASLSDWSNNLLDSVAYLSGSCHGANYDWDLIW